MIDKNLRLTNDGLSYKNANGCILGIAITLISFKVMLIFTTRLVSFLDSDIIEIFKQVIKNLFLLMQKTFIWLKEVIFNDIHR